MRITLSCLLVLVLTARVSADPSDAGVEFFEKKIRPVLVEHCYPCHSAKTKKRGGLALDTREGLRKGGDRGPAIVPGKPDESLLIRAVRRTEKPLQMPPKEKLSAAAVADLTVWVKMGAPDPRVGPPAPPVGSWQDVLKARRNWWSLQAVQHPVVPTTRNLDWPLDPVDRFLLARLEAAGLTPARPADRRTLIRRLSLVLTGLPPTPAEVDAFVADSSPDAYDRLVERLLASPHFGERWARHWLDVVHFSETHGNEWNYEVHHAWRYRDYLIRAFNQDVPYDQLVREHIAGDLLPRPRVDRQGQVESVIGTAFYRFGEVNHDDCISLPQIGYDLVDNQIDTLSKAFQATTVACARCHDHKLDAVSMKDYYALMGILRSSRLVSHTIDPEANLGAIQRLQTLKAAIRRELGAVWLREAREISRYLLRAKDLDPGRLRKWEAALSDAKAPAEDPLAPWRAIASGKSNNFATAWRKLAEQHARQDREREEFNREQFVSFADFRTGRLESWDAGGQGLRNGPGRSGDFALHHEGDLLVKAVLPAGYFTHALSDRLNGTLRSPILPPGKKYISFEVLGQRSSAVRLVSNNCQLNYKNYRALTANELRWVTFEMPANREELRTYAELMTMLDNPKFPDQLSALGGDPANYRLPWEQAAANPRSHFGVTRVVLHDAPEPPRAERSHLRPLFAGAAPASLAELAARYGTVIEQAVKAWTADRASDDDVRWLDALLRRGLLSNSVGITNRLAELTAEYRATEKTLSQPQIVPGVADHGPGFEQAVFVRGDCARPGERVPRRYLEALSRPGERFEPRGSGRLELAERTASADNPLTARVMVNRIWHHLFGEGIVRTVDDFGRAGELPSHPKLLDHLAMRFVKSGWSIKSLLRILVRTRAFQMSNRPPALGHQIDPHNRLLHHYPARRLEAEGIRDCILAASGRLDRRLFGPSIQPFRDKTNADRRLFPGPLDGHGRRSVYIKNNLMESPAFLGVFDFPGGKVTRGRRHVTNVPAQALALLNDPFVIDQARRWAEGLVARRDASVSERIVYLFQVGLSRPPNAEERRRFERAVDRLGELHGVSSSEVLRNRAVWQDVAHTMFNLQEFIYIP